MPEPTPVSLHNAQVQAVLSRLHSAARKDWMVLPRLLPMILAGLARGKPLTAMFNAQTMRDCYISVSPQQGDLLYVAARHLKARRIVEFGTSYGVSTVYLACALRDNGGGLVIGSEMIPEKHAQALANLRQAGVADFAEILLGNALETFRDIPAPVDMVLLDAGKDFYLPILEILKPKLRPGALVLADNIFTFRKALRPYVEYVQSGRNGFVSTTLPVGDGFEYSCYLG